jgi:uncharacterized protein (TIGR03085 family)
VSYARDERLALCALLDEIGPQAPTLCAGWRTVDLAAHLVLRERRPDAAAGILGGPLAAYTERVRRTLAAGTPFAELVRTIRSGPPRLSIYGVPGMDELLNASEFFVHHEDVRRAQPGWEPRDLGPAFADALWRQLRGAGHLLRRIPVGVEFARESARDDDQRQARMTVRRRTPVVTVTGPPAELMMWAFGRTEAARVRIDGADDDVAALAQASWGI